MSCITNRKENRPIGLLGQRHKHYIREHKRAFYATLPMSGKLNSYLAGINKQAQEIFSRLVEQMAEREGVID